jgi:hypothetical protein
MAKTRGLSVVCDNTFGLTSDDVNMPIKKNGVAIGTITYVNEKSIYGLIWDECIDFNREDNSFEIKTSKKQQSTVLYRGQK